MWRNGRRRNPGISGCGGEDRIHSKMGESRRYIPSFLFLLPPKKSSRSFSNSLTLPAGHIFFIRAENNFFWEMKLRSDGVKKKRNIHMTDSLKSDRLFNTKTQICMLIWGRQKKEILPGSGTTWPKKIPPTRGFPHKRF